MNSYPVGAFFVPSACFENRANQKGPWHFRVKKLYFAESAEEEKK